MSENHSLGNEERIRVLQLAVEAAKNDSRKDGHNKLEKTVRGTNMIPEFIYQFWQALQCPEYFLLFLVFVFGVIPLVKHVFFDM